MVERLSVEYRSLASLRFDPRNPRLHSKKQIGQIARSIDAFGFNVPILIDAKGQVIAGHGRALAAERLRMSEVPTIVLENLNESQIRAFTIADNRLTENSTWDERLLAEQLQSLSTVNLDFEVDVTGFEMKEIDLRVESLAPVPRHKNDIRADAVPDSAIGPQITQLGDIWILDRHRIICGDARVDSTYSGLMEGRRADVVFADPPYADSSVRDFRGARQSEFSSLREEKRDSEFSLMGTLAQAARSSVDGAFQFICTDWRHSEELLASVDSTHLELAGLCVWVKDKPSQDSPYLSQHELVFVFKKRGEQLRTKIRHRRTNVWRYAGANSSSRSCSEGDSATHPTIKPVKLVADAIRDCTSRGSAVLDPFLGCGTTLIAAEQTGRCCYGIDIEPRYLDTAVRRWQAFTGHSAIQKSTGRTFDQMERNDGRSD